MAKLTPSSTPLNKIDVKIATIHENLKNLLDKFALKGGIDAVKVQNQNKKESICYAEACVKLEDGSAFPFMKAITLEELEAKIALLKTSLNDFKFSKQEVNLYEVMFHLEKKIDFNPALHIILLEINSALEQSQLKLEMKESESIYTPSITIH